MGKAEQIVSDLTTSLNQIQPHQVEPDNRPMKDVYIKDKLGTDINTEIHKLNLSVLHQVINAVNPVFPVIINFHKTYYQL